MKNCPNCRSTIQEEIKYQTWLRLIATIDVLRTQGEISDATHEQMYNDLMIFGNYAKNVEDVNGKYIG